MAFNAVNPVTVGLATKKDHYDRVFDNTIELRGGGIAIPLQSALDVIIAISATQFGRVAVGTALQVLRVNAAGNGLEFGPGAPRIYKDPLYVGRSRFGGVSG